MTEKEKKLAWQLLERYAETRDPRIRDTLFLMYKPLADSVVNRFAPYQIDKDDLRQEAYRRIG